MNNDIFENIKQGIQNLISISTYGRSFSIYRLIALILLSWPEQPGCSFLVICCCFNTCVADAISSSLHNRHLLIFF